MVSMAVERIRLTRFLCFLLFSVVVCWKTSVANQHAKRLYDQLLRRRGYSKIVRPVFNSTERVNVKIGLKLSQLIDLDERNQVMTTNVWVTQEWEDPSLSWDPREFGNVDMIYVPASSIWIPDIVLYNTADGVYEMTTGTKAIVSHTGLVKWKPPASFKSSCLIDVTYFPFDEQQCGFQFGSWTYNIYEVDIGHVRQDEEASSIDPDSIDRTSAAAAAREMIREGIDLSDFYRSAEWDLMAAPAIKRNRSYAGSVEPFPEWTFNVTLKRKFLFYTVNLIIPLMSHAFITVLVFYIPAASTEKMSLSINILLSLTVFFLMLVEIIPPTSLVVPLLGKYLIFTLILVSSSVIITVITYNVHFRSSATHRLPNWARKVFLYWLPRMLMMRRPEVENLHDVHLKLIRLCTCLPSSSSEADPDPSTVDRIASLQDDETLNSGRYDASLNQLSLQYEADQQSIAMSDLSPAVQRAVEGALYIANHLKRQDEFCRTMEDWKFVALVIDRIFLWIYAIVCLSGTVIIICQAPMLYDNRDPVVHK